jgi:hypothetical protein
MQRHLSERPNSGRRINSRSHYLAVGIDRRAGFLSLAACTISGFVLLRRLTSLRLLRTLRLLGLLRLLRLGLRFWLARTHLRLSIQG